MKKILPVILKSLAGTVVAIGLLEVMVRLLMPAPIDLLRLNNFVESERGKFAQYDKNLGWAGKPDVSGDFQWVDTNHHVTQNKFGFRGPAYKTGKSKKRRVLVLGDSFVWGFGVENDQIFTSLAEDQTGGAVEVINTGVSGYGNDQEFLFWHQRGLDWQPDEVLLVITPYTDIVDNLFAKRYGYPKPQFVATLPKDAPAETPPTWQLTNVPVPRGGDFSGGGKTRSKVAHAHGLPLGLGNLQLSRMLVNAAATNPSLRQKMEDDGLIPRRLPGYNWEYPLFETQPSAQARQGWQTMFALVGMLKQDVEAHGAHLTVAIVPSITQVYPELWQRFAAARRPGGTSPLDPENPNRRIKNWCVLNDVPVVDLLPPLREAGQENSFLYFPYNLHWTAAGHEIVAEALRSVIAGQ